MNKILFLDIDGVLNSIETAKAIQKYSGQRVIPGPVFVEPPFTRENLNWGLNQVSNLKFIVDQTGCSIVIVSSWREKFPWATSFIDMFAAYGWNNAPVGSITPLHGLSRGDEVDEWIKYGQAFQVPIVDYVILDDDDDYSSEQHSHLILISKQVGLQTSDALAAIKILNPE